MNSTVIHGISAKYFLPESVNFSLSSEFNHRKRDFWGKGEKFSLSDKKYFAYIPCITVEFIANS